MNTDSTELLAIGKIVKAFGIAGDVAVLPMTDSPARFLRLREALIGRDTARVEPRRILRVLVDSRGVRMHIEGISDRNGAERLVGSLVFVDAEHRVKLPKGRFFVHDIVGMAVVDELRGPVGRVRDVLKMPGNDVYVIEFDGREYMIPAVKSVVRCVDVKSNRMDVRLIEGMLDEGSAEQA